MYRVLSSSGRSMDSASIPTHKIWFSTSQSAASSVSATIVRLEMVPSG